MIAAANAAEFSRMQVQGVHQIHLQCSVSSPVLLHYIGQLLDLIMLED